MLFGAEKIRTGIEKTSLPGCLGQMAVEAMTTCNLKTLVATLVIVSVGCSSSEPTVLTTTDMQSHSPKAQGDQKADQWTAQDAPNLFSADLEYRLDELPRDGEAAVIPWAGNYWPVYKDSINDRWAGPDTLSPAAKYGKAFDVEGVEDAVSSHHGIDRHASRTVCTTDDQCDDKIGEKCAIREGKEEGRCIPTWWGICHAWAPVAILQAEPVRPVTRNGVTFEVNDIKALVTLAHDRVQTRFVSLRCDADEEADAIEYDGYGRPAGDDINCKDTNPGTFHVLLANYLGLRGESFVEDRTFDDEVWNQPIRGYRITHMEEVSPLDANLLVGAKAQGDEAGITTETHKLAKNEFVKLPPIDVVPGNWITIDIKGIEADEDAPTEGEEATVGPGDADLYVRLGAEVTKTEYDCRPNQGNSDEHCEMTVPEGTTQLYIALNGFKASHVELVVTRNALAGIPETYIFNSEAAKLFYVHSEVDFIAESDADTDGHLGDVIDRYTRTDRYQYILEVDSDGKVFGGEWVGASKRDHPDFLWLPTGRGHANIAGGTMSWSFIKSLLDESLAPENPETGVVTFREAAHVNRGDWKHFGPYNATTGDVTITMTGNGDADLYVRRGSEPTEALYDCRPYQNGSDETCTLNGAGAYYISVHGYANSEFEFRVTLDTTPGAETVTNSDSTADANNPISDTNATNEETNDTNNTTEETVDSTEETVDTNTNVEEPSNNTSETVHLNETGHAATGVMNHYTLPLVAGQRAVIRTVASTDVDLYIRFGMPPTTTSYDARGYTFSGDETVEFTAASDGVLHIGVHGYAAGDYQLSTAAE
jgi:hypothetical protein